MRRPIKQAEFTNSHTLANTCTYKYRRNVHIYIYTHTPNLDLACTHTHTEVPKSWPQYTVQMRIWVLVGAAAGPHLEGPTSAEATSTPLGFKQVNHSHQKYHV